MPERRSDALLSRIGSLATSGARAAEVFSLAGHTFLAVPQLAYDVPGTPAHMNGGDSDTDLLLFRWNGNGFVEHDRLPVPGGEDAEFFTIDGAPFLATASARSGKGPYEPNVASTIFRWDGSVWLPFQEVPGFFAKQWRHFTFGGRHFLALALGVTIEGYAAVNPHRSCIFTWDGQAFRPLQALAGLWGYNWEHIQIGGRNFLAYADHVGSSEVLEWDGSAFGPFQVLDGKSGRAFQTVRVGGGVQLAFASIAEDTVVLQWNGARFDHFQTLSGPGGREFAATTCNGNHYLVQINFIEGSPKDPKTDLVSFIHRWDAGRWRKVGEFETFGATDAAFFAEGPRTFLLFTNSLTPQVRFRQDTAVYEFFG